MISKKKRKRMLRKLKRNTFKTIKYLYYKLTHPKIKLNILGPGTKICEACGILLIVALVFYLISFNKISYIVCWVDAIIFLILLLLLKFEQYQDDREYEEWQRRNFESNHGHQY